MNFGSFYKQFFWDSFSLNILLKERFYFVLVYAISELLDGSKSSASPVRSSVPVGSGLTRIVIGGRSLILISFLNNSPMGFYGIVKDIYK